MSTTKDWLMDTVPEVGIVFQKTTVQSNLSRKIKYYVKERKVMSKISKREILRNTLKWMRFDQCLTSRKLVFSSSKEETLFFKNEWGMIVHLY